MFTAIYKKAIINNQEDLLKELIDMGMPVTSERGVTPMDIITGVLRRFAGFEFSISNDIKFDTDPLTAVSIYNSLSFLFS